MESVYKLKFSAVIIINNIKNIKIEVVMEIIKNIDIKTILL